MRCTLGKKKGEDIDGNEAEYGNDLYGDGQVLGRWGVGLYNGSVDGGLDQGQTAAAYGESIFLLIGLNMFLIWGQIGVARSKTRRFSVWQVFVASF